MELKDILTVHGQSGLFKYVSQGRNGIIVEQIDAAKRRTSVSSTTRISSMQDIVIFTAEGDIPLRKVFLALKEHTKGELALSHKSADEELKIYFEQIVPNYSKDKVHLSDIKKMLSWYNILQQCNIIGELKLDEEETVQETTDETTPVKSAVPKSKSTVTKPSNNAKPVSKSAGGQKMTIPRKAQ